MKKIVSNIILTTFILLLSVFSIKAQDLKLLWKSSAKGVLLWHKVTPMGQVIAASTVALICFDPVKGGAVWTNTDLANTPESSYATIDNTPFISISANKRFLIINPFDGAVIFNSDGAGLQQVNDKYFLYKNNKILVTGQTNGSKNTELVMVDMNSGKKAWSKSGGFSLLTGVKELDNGEVLITSAFYAMKLNIADGKEIWKKPIDPKTANFQMMFSMLEGFGAKMLSKEDLNAQLIIPESRQDMFVIAAQKKIQSTSTDTKGKSTTSYSYHSVYMAFDINSGDYKWKSVVELSTPLGVNFAGPQGLIVGSGSNGDLNMLNYNDGSLLLGKKGRGLSLKGPVTGYAELGNGQILIVSEKGSNSAITLLDPATGNLMFEKALKMKGVVSYTEVLPQGILIGSNEEVNLLNPSTGDWFFEKAMTGGAGLISSFEEQIYLFNTKDGLVYKMDRNATSAKPMGNTPIKFGGKEDPQSLQATDEGVLVKSDQNMAMVDYSGKIKYNKYYPAPGQSAFKKAMLIAAAVQASFYTAAFTATSVAAGTASQRIHVKNKESKISKSVNADVSTMFGEASVAGAKYTVGFLTQVNQRFHATSEFTKQVLIMSDLGTGKGIGLLQVSKTNGEVLNTLMLGRDREPIYDVDMVEGRLFYLNEKKELEAYQF